MSGCDFLKYLDKAKTSLISAKFALKASDDQIE